MSGHRYNCFVKVIEKVNKHFYSQSNIKRKGKSDLSFFKRLSSNYNILLNEQQQKAVMHDAGPALVLSGPGSGKTTVIISRLAYLIMEKEVDPSCILSMSFNRMAAFEMQDRFWKIFSDAKIRNIRFSTMHSFCYQIIRNYQSKINKKYVLLEGSEGTAAGTSTGTGAKAAAGTVVASGKAVNVSEASNAVKTDKRTILRNIYYKINNEYLNEDELELLINEIGYIKNKMITEIKEKDFSTARISNILKEYETYKKRNSMIDFDDMLSLSYEILSSHADILNYYRHRYKYLQIDEGQDLSKIQFKIINLLVQPECNLFMVADDDQSIYSFRGAEPEYILDFKKEYNLASIYYLEKNYRSTKNIVEISSKFIKANRGRYDKNHFTDNGNFANPDIYILKDEKEQLTCLLDELKKHKAVADGGIGNMAILFRNNLSSILIADILEKNNIDFFIAENKITFLNHWFVLDMLAFLRFSLDPSDIDSFKRIYYKINRYITKNIFGHAAGIDAGKPVAERLLSYPELLAYQRINIIEMKTEFKKLSRMKAGNALSYITETFRYIENAREYCDKTGYSFSVVKNLMTILKLIADKQYTIADFCGRLVCLEKILCGSRNSGEDVVLSTVHSSKGLEYDCVFIIDMVEGEFPGSKSIEDERISGNMKAIEEERRLFYVAVTRARKYVKIFGALSKNGLPATMSRFVDEIHGCILDQDLKNNAERGIILSTDV